MAQNRFQSHSGKTIKTIYLHFDWLFRLGPMHPFQMPLHMFLPLEISVAHGAREVALAQMDGLEVDVEPLLAGVRLVAPVHGTPKQNVVLAQVDVLEVLVEPLLPRVGFVTAGDFAPKGIHAL